MSWLHNITYSCVTYTFVHGKLDMLATYQQELETTWATLEFMIDKHPRTGVALIRTSEEMIETLEENQVGICSTVVIDTRTPLRRSL